MCKNKKIKKKILVEVFKKKKNTHTILEAIDA